MATTRFQVLSTNYQAPPVTVKLSTTLMTNCSRCHKTGYVKIINGRSAYPIYTCVCGTVAQEIKAKK